MQRNCGCAVCDLEGNWLGFCIFRVPELGCFAGYAEGGVNGCFLLATVVDEVKVAIGELTVNEEQLGIRRRL